MKLHQNLVGAVVEGLLAIFGEERYADKVIESLLRSNPKWGSSDRGFIAETTYDMVRHWRLLWYLADSEPSLKSHALWQLFGVYWMWRGFELPDWFKWERPEAIAITARFEQAKQSAKLLYSFPDWLDARANNELGSERWTKEAAALNMQTQVVLRANTLKTDRDTLIRLLAEHNVEAYGIAQLPDAIVLKKRLNIFGNPLYKQGLFEIQDAASQLVAPFSHVQPGMRVIDACAGAGGKTLHLAALMQNKGSIISMDVEAFKLDELRRRARRAGVSIAETRLIENNKTIKRLRESADVVLLDAPCSGTGVIRRNPDSKWKLSEDFIERIQETQRDILRRYSQMTKPGGTLVYATCSILPSENMHQIEWFLGEQEGKNFVLEEQRAVMPSEFGFDGFYMARLRRK
ncbi:MAG: RsmB/NOP family class I SAM-dependent RNA methyltransferase [Cytophagales bacterium]|nr:RsmB/NOP family class I SAM-dependent RNA methyltransferase [Bernardetiaceae bacterium]MDW8205313.1 RsmB/NOP family class I SAM-dependent RNA methyltransferase [Cytophagales bacterium]